MSPVSMKQLDQGNKPKAPVTMLTRRQVLQMTLTGLGLAALEQLAGCTPTNAPQTAEPTPLLIETLNLGTWIYTLRPSEIRVSAHVGFDSTRGYLPSDAVAMAAVSRALGLSHLGGLDVNTDKLLADWHSQVQWDAMTELYNTEVPLVAVAVGNEVRDVCPGEGLCFPRPLVEDLTNVINGYHQWADRTGWKIKLTTTIQGDAFDANNVFYDWVLPLIDTCDVVAMNLYPMAEEDWFGTQAFKSNQQFLTDLTVRQSRLDRFEEMLRALLEQIIRRGKALILAETGFPSGVDYQQYGSTIIPLHDRAAFGDAYMQFASLLARVRADFRGNLRGIYLYEWMDNLHHPKIEAENSPIHTCFGLCDSNVLPKFDLNALVQRLRQS